MLVGELGGEQSVSKITASNKSGAHCKKLECDKRARQIRSNDRTSPHKPLNANVMPTNKVTPTGRFQGFNCKLGRGAVFPAGNFRSSSQIRPIDIASVIGNVDAACTQCGECSDGNVAER